MPNLALLTPGTSVDLALYLVTAMDYADITASSATQIVMTEGARTFTLTGTGFSITNIGGVDYINSGTVDAITINEGAGDVASFTALAMTASTLRFATRTDREGTNSLALEDLFRKLTYTINGTAGVDRHEAGTSAEGFSIALTRGNTYNLDSGDDVVTQAGSGNDSLYGAGGNDSLLGNAGNDSVDGAENNDTIYGGTGNDTLRGGFDSDNLYGDDGDDDLLLDDSGQMSGGTGNDTLTGAANNGSLQYGGDGNDVLRGNSDFAYGGGADILYGGTGNDDLSVSSLAPSGGQLYGDAGHDTLTGSSSNETLYGGEGNDSLNGREGIDLLYGDAGNDVLILGDLGSAYGGTGHDTISATFGFLDIFLNGGAGHDLITGSSDTDTIVGGTGNDRAFGGDGLDEMSGGDGNDSLDGGGEIDTLYGGEGNDTLQGGGETDYIYGDEGNDSLIGGVGADELIGGEGIDVASYAASTLGVTVDLGAGGGIGGDAQGDTLSGIENLTGSGQNDVLTGDGPANLLAGGAGLDTLAGGGGSDTLDGGTGGDSLDGGTGADSLIGGTGNDTLTGGSGADTLIGGGNIDVMTGGSGADVFLFLAVTDTGNGARDSITDLASGVDVVSFAGLGLTYVTGAFTGAGQIRWDAGLSRLQINTDANLAADRQVDLIGVGANFDAGTDLIL